MIILDTNLVSEPTKPNANRRVLVWLDRQDQRSLYLTAINLAELLEGVALLPEGKRKQSLQTAQKQFLERLVVTPILPFDRAAALAYVGVVVRAKARRYTLPVADGQIAAIAKVHGFAVATRDVGPFLAVGVRVINPWDEA